MIHEQKWWSTHFTRHLASAQVHQVPPIPPAPAPGASIVPPAAFRSAAVKSSHVILLLGEKLLQFICTRSWIQREVEEKWILFLFNQKIKRQFCQKLSTTFVSQGQNFGTNMMNIFCSYNCLRPENLTPISSAVISNLLLKFKFWFVHNLLDCSRELQVSGADFLCIYQVWGRSARA